MTFRWIFYTVNAVNLCCQMGQISILCHSFSIDDNHCISMYILNPIILNKLLIRLFLYLFIETSGNTSAERTYTPASCFIHSFNKNKTWPWSELDLPFGRFSIWKIRGGKEETDFHFVFYFEALCKFHLFNVVGRSRIQVLEWLQVSASY